MAAWLLGIFLRALLRADIAPEDIVVFITVECR
jgi:hypothetical protein